jgi:hypothetical protein
VGRVFIDGFETGDTQLWDYVIGTSVTAAVSGMGGSYSLRTNGASTGVQKDITADDEMYFAFKVRPTAGNAKPRLYLLNNTTSMLYVELYFPGEYITVKTGSGGTLATGTTAIYPGVTYLIEVYVKIADSGGRVVVKIDRNTTDIDFTGDTLTEGESQFNRFKIVMGDGDCYVDDVVLDDANWIGQTFIQPLVVTGAGNSTQWSPSSGSNYTCVDERPASDSDFVSTDSVDQLDLFTASDLAGDIEAIKCVQVVARAVQEGAPTPQNVQLAVRSGGSNYFSGDKAVPLTTPADLFHIWETDPDTASAWTESGVNALEIGVKSVA